MPPAISVYTQFIQEPFDCARNYSFTTQYEDYEIDDFDENDWNRVWSEAIDIVKQC